MHAFHFRFQFSKISMHGTNNSLLKLAMKISKAFSLSVIPFCNNAFSNGFIPNTLKRSKNDAFDFHNATLYAGVAFYITPSVNNFSLVGYEKGFKLVKKCLLTETKDT